MSDWHDCRDGRIIYPILDESGRTTGWTHIPPVQRSPEYTSEPLEQVVAELKRQLWNAQRQIEKMKR